MRISEVTDAGCERLSLGPLGSSGYKKTGCVLLIVSLRKAEPKRGAKVHWETKLHLKSVGETRHVWLPRHPHSS